MKKTISYISYSRTLHKGICRQMITDNIILTHHLFSSLQNPYFFLVHPHFFTTSTD